MKAILAGMRTALARPHFAIALWLAQAALVAPLALPISNFLHEELNHAPEAAGMISAPNFRWWKTQRRVHPDLVGDLPESAEALISRDGVPGIASFDTSRGLGAAFLGIGILGIFVHAFLLGGIFGSLHDDKGNNLAVFAREGARRFPAFLLVTVAAAAIAAAIYHSVFYASGRALREFTEDLVSERAALAIVGLRLLALVLLLSLVKISADAIRVALVERPDLPPFTRYFVGVGTALARLPGLLALLASYTAATLLLFFFWSRLNVNKAATTTGGVVLLVAAQQVFIFLRSMTKVGYYAGLREAVLARPAPPPGNALGDGAKPR